MRTFIEQNDWGRQVTNKVIIEKLGYLIYSLKYADINLLRKLHYNQKCPKYTVFY